MTTKHCGMTTFIKLTGYSAPMVRALEARGIVQPLKSDRGWRLFRVPEDVDAALMYRGEQQRQRLNLGGRGDHD